MDWFVPPWDMIYPPLRLPSRLHGPNVRDKNLGITVFPSDVLLHMAIANRLFLSFSMGPYLPVPILLVGKHVCCADLYI